MCCYVIRLNLIKLNVKSFAKLFLDNAWKQRRKFFSSNLSRSAIIVTLFNWIDDFPRVSFQILRE